MKRKFLTSRPSAAVLEAELRRLAHKKKNRQILSGVISVTAIFCLSLLLVFLLWYPVLQVHGNSMAPALTEGDLILCVKTDKVSQGQIAAFYHNNKLLVKRVIALAGDTVDIASDGKVHINETPLSEPYIAELSAGVIDIPLPCRIPWDHAFMLGDNRPTSLDSRSSDIGTVPRERIFAVAVFRLWPLHRIGWI